MQMLIKVIEIHFLIKFTLYNYQLNKLYLLINKKWAFRPISYIFQLPNKLASSIRHHQYLTVGAVQLVLKFLHKKKLALAFRFR